ncbi:MAG: hypothetical protein LBB37_05490 [Endomicrobium sp.]|jgi:hypothetical protein|nr:hypothetical protein [Endomicrobium sp.]
MEKFINIIIFSLLLSSCSAISSQQNLKDNAFDIVKSEPEARIIQKLDKDTAFVAYPARRDGLGFVKYEKRYYVKSNILKNYADDDEIIGYKVEKIQDKTYSYTSLDGYPHTVSYGQLIQK